MQCKVSINVCLLPTGLSTKVSRQTEQLSKVSKCWRPSGKGIFGQTLTVWTGQWSPWRQCCPGKTCSWAVWLGEQCGHLTTGWYLFALWQEHWWMRIWLLLSFESIWPCFLLRCFPARVLGWQVQAAAPAAELWHFKSIVEFYFSVILFISLSAAVPQPCCSSTERRTLCTWLYAVRWVVTIMATIKT